MVCYRLRIDMTSQLRATIFVSGQAKMAMFQAGPFSTAHMAQDRTVARTGLLCLGQAGGSANWDSNTCKYIYIYIYIYWNVNLFTGGQQNCPRCQKKSVYWIIDRWIGQEEALTPIELTSRAEPSSGGSCPEQHRPFPAGSWRQRSSDALPRCCQTSPKIPRRNHASPLSAVVPRSAKWVFSHRLCRRKKPRWKQSTVGWKLSFAIASNGHHRLCTPSSSSWRRRSNPPVQY
jgi:hypothetical protein